jgi:predicted MFS family arabinose efflux permease
MSANHEIPPQCNLILSKVLFFSTALSTVGWNRFQNNFFIDHGLSNTDIGMLKSIGLLTKIVGEPVLCVVADSTNLKIVFFLGVLMSIFTMEILRTTSPLTFQVVVYVKLLRTFVSPIGTLTTTSALHLIRGSQQGFGEQRAFGSIAWGAGALCIGYFIDAYGMSSLFYYTYSLNIIMMIVILVAVPSKVSRESHGSSVAQNSSSGLSRGILRDDPMKEIGSKGDVLGSMEEAPHLMDTDRNGDHSNSDEEDIPLLWDDATGTWAKIVHDDASRSPRYTIEYTAISGSSSGAVSAMRERSAAAWMILRLHLVPYLRLMREPSLSPLLVNVFVYGTAMTVIDTFLYVGIEREFHVSRTFNGLMTAVSVLGAVPAFWYSDKTIKRHGHSLVLLGAQVVCAIRLVLSAAIWTLPASTALLLLLLLQLSHSVCFALYWACVVDRVSSAAPSGILNGAVAMVSALYFTVGGAVGNVLWGGVYDSLGSMTGVFLLAGAGVAALVVWQRAHNFGSVNENATK